MIFRVVGALVLIATVGLLIALFKRRPQLVQTYFSADRFRPGTKQSILQLRRLLESLFLISLSLLSVTGLLAAVVLGRPLTGLLLLLHLIAAPIFVLSAVALALLLAAGQRFTAQDWNRLTFHSGNPGTLVTQPPVRKALFWCGLFLTFLVIVSILSSMFSLFGTQALGLFLTIHRWTGLGLVVVGALLGVKNGFHSNE